MPMVPAKSNATAASLAANFIDVSGLNALLMGCV
jgi:hypothetical protein